MNDFPSRIRFMMTGKIHRATVTGADIHYVGSVTVDSLLLEAADILPGERVDVVDVNNGSRLTTYAIAGEAGSGIVQLNGAAAHLVEIGHKVIIIAYGSFTDHEAKKFKPHVVFVNEHNHLVNLSDKPGHAPSSDGSMVEFLPPKPLN